MSPLAFKIRQFKSIIDSGICSLSGDDVTVLAGQNEAGKTAVLKALRDFDRPSGSVPSTKDYIPDNLDDDTRPEVHFLFKLLPLELSEVLQDMKGAVWDDELLQFTDNLKELWVKRDLLSGQFSLHPEVDAKIRPYYPEDDDSFHSSLMDKIRMCWPQHVYFDAFDQYLPREILLSDIMEADGSVQDSCPQPVKDFIALSGISLKKIEEISTEDRALANYLDRRSAAISGDFLKYWNQKIGIAERVSLSVRANRDPKGALKLSFYVQGKNLQAPDQRSKGFLWYLAFFLRLAATEVAEGAYLLLIDEPGTYLHARAQKDVLAFLEERVVKTQYVVYSTHSPFLLPADKLHRVRLVVKKSDKGTLVLDRLTHPELTESESRDTLTPILNAVGFDLRDLMSFQKENALIVEGFSDYMYLTGMSNLILPSFNSSVSIFPGSGSGTMQVLGSLLTGWGIPFAIMMDRDRPNDKTSLMKNFDLGDDEIAHPNGGMAIEDVFSRDCFLKLLACVDKSLVAHDKDKTPTAIIKSARVDKILLARKFLELSGQGKFELDNATRGKMSQLLDDSLACCAQAKLRRGRFMASSEAQNSK